MNKLMIIGGGFGQIPAILSAKRKGIHTIVLDKKPDAPGMGLADQAEVVDIIDLPACLQIALSNSINGVMTLQSDIGVPTVGAIVDAMHLPGNGYDTAIRCSNKILTREALEAKGVPQPGFSVVNLEGTAKTAAEKLGYPCVFKAPDSSGSRGVVKVKSPNDVAVAFAEAMRYSRQGKILVEEFIHGLELGAQAFSRNGECISVLVHDDTLSPPPYMIPVGHAFPSGLDTRSLQNVEAAVKACVEALGIDEGPSNIDFILDANGTPRMIEVGARIGATCLPELVQHHTGIDWVAAAINSALGLEPNLAFAQHMPCAAHILEAPQDGILREVNIPRALKSHPDLLEFELAVHPGEHVSKLRKGTDRIGKIIVRAVSKHEANTLAMSLKASIKYTIS